LAENVKKVNVKITNSNFEYDITLYKIKEFEKHLVGNQATYEWKGERVKEFEKEFEKEQEEMILVVINKHAGNNNLIYDISFTYIFSIEYYLTIAGVIFGIIFLIYLLITILIIIIFLYFNKYKTKKTIKKQSTMEE
jgi:uncharacterized membrane protein